MELTDNVSNRLMNIQREITKTISAFSNMGKSSKGSSGATAFDGVTKSAKTSEKAVAKAASSTQLMLTGSINTTKKSIEGATTSTTKYTTALTNSSKVSDSMKGPKLSLTWEDINNSVKKNKTSQTQYNEEVGKSSTLMNQLKQAAIGIGGLIGVKKLISLTDTMTLTTARLNLINDGLQTTDELQDKIFASAQKTRSSYMDTAAVVGKLGILAKDSFASNDEAILFAEQMAKQFKIGGSSVQESTSAMYQLTQAMASGRLQGDEFRSILENAPILAQAIAKEMGKSIGELKAMSSEGLITADIIKKALFNTADETNEQFKKLPMTFGQVGTSIGNMLLQTFNPVLQGIGHGAQVIFDNWSTIEPIFWGIGGALLFYAAATGIQTAATWLAVAANRALVTAMLTNPIGWIALGIGLIITLIYKWIKSVGGIKVAWLIMTNGILNAWSVLSIGMQTGVMNIQNAVGTLKASVLIILQDMVNKGITIVNDFINKLNKLPGVSIDAISQVTFGTTSLLAEQKKIQERASDLNISKLKAQADKQLREDKIDAAKKAAATTSNLDLSGYDGLDDIMNGLNDIAANTGDTASSMESSEEDLAYLRDIAEREAINRFTTADIKVEMSNSNNISSSMDIDGIINEFGTKLKETIEEVKEGVNR